MSQSDLNPVGFKLILSKLIKTPQDFTDADIQLAINHVVTPGAALPEQLGAFLTGLAIARVELRKDILLAAASFVYSRSVPAIVNDADKHFIVDIVGTGGDGHNTFNVSTTAAMIAAGAGARVIKHGSGASTSSSGSADLLHALGCVFTPPRGGKPSPVPDIPLVFLLAPHYHPSLAALAPARRALPFRTLFNALGPLLNPARPRGMLVGVAEPALGPPYVAALRAAGVRRGFVVCGAEGLDEISCAGDTRAWELREDGENAATLRALLTSGDDIPEHLTPILDFVLLNAAALLVVAGRADDFVDGVALAKEAVTSGKAWRALEWFREYSLKDAAEAVVGA
ncbi:glycosyl transferase [Lactarius akahatsu]|uniref:Glycosyl transferase n=1 Tax=Lactarius akahatsu TaxID=416441 RepID=A0AAD4L4G4_9AGAM|nr:glycosyl transferase [Lactarius akahatsu]